MAVEFGWLNPETWLKIHDLILKIYAIDNLKSMRMTFLNQIRELIPYTRGFFDLCKDSRHNCTFFDPVAVNIPDDFLKNYFEYYQHVDYANWIFTQQSSIVYRDTDLVGGNFRENLEYFRDWFLPLGLYYGAGTSIIAREMVLGSVTLYRGREEGDFTDTELFILKLLNDHLENRLIHLFPSGIREISGEDYSAPEMSKLFLSNREREIATLVLNGYSNREIGEVLYITEATVKKHLWNIFKKLKIKSRVQLISALR